MSVNKVIVLGRLGQEPELKNLPSGSAVCNLSVATSEKFKDKAGELQEKTEWHRVTVFGKVAESCAQYLKKGREVYVEGRLQTRSWEKDGQKHYATEIVADTVQFIGGNQGGSAPANKPSRERTAPDFAQDDIPFSPIP